MLLLLELSLCQFCPLLYSTISISDSTMTLDGNLKGAINLLLTYKKEFRALGGYLTDGRKPNLSRVELYIQAVEHMKTKFSVKEIVCITFYPYHYAPFASDLKDLGQLNINFELGSPIKPSNQLLGVFPAASSHALPQQYRKLMTDSNSPIIDFYPVDFEVDINGKRFAWQIYVYRVLPNCLSLMKPVFLQRLQKLKDEEVWRNSRMYDMLFVSVSHPLSPNIFPLDDRRQLDDKEHNQI